jgi:hypothetical protein
MPKAASVKQRTSLRVSLSSNDDENKERRLAGEHRERFGIDSRFSAGRYAGGVRSRRSEHRIYCQRR